MMRLDARLAVPASQNDLHPGYVRDSVVALKIE